MSAEARAGTPRGPSPAAWRAAVAPYIGPDASRAFLQLSTTLALRYAYGTGVIGGLRFTDAGAESDAENVESDVTAHELSVNLGSGLTF